MLTPTSQRLLNLLRVARESRAFCVVGTIGFIIDAGLLQFLITRFGVNVLLGRVVSYLTTATVDLAAQPAIHVSTDRPARLPRGMVQIRGRQRRRRWTELWR